MLWGRDSDKFRAIARTQIPSSLRNETTPGRPLNGSPSRPISEQNHLATIKKKNSERSWEGAAAGGWRTRVQKGERRRKIAGERDKDNSAKLDRIALSNSCSFSRRVRTFSIKKTISKLMHWTKKKNSEIIRIVFKRCSNIQTVPGEVLRDEITYRYSEGQLR